MLQAAVVSYVLILFSEAAKFIGFKELESVYLELYFAFEKNLKIDFVTVLETV